MPAERPLLVVNPASGGGKTGQTFGAMLPAVTDALGPCEVAYTRRRGHAIDIARDAAREGYAPIIAVGGDGTFHEVVNGVMDAGGKTPVGLIAQGTGGDFRKTVGLEHRLDKYLEALRSGKRRTIDVGKARYREKDGSTKERWFVNILSAGMGGLVDRYVADAPAHLGGKAAYFGASLKALLRCKEGRVRAKITNDGKTEERMLRTYMLAVCNGRFFGGGMKVAPMAMIDDGKLEVVSIGAANKVAFAVHANKIYDGSHLTAPGTEHFSCDAIELDLENEDVRNVFLNDIDGEPLGGLPLSIELHKGALTLQA